MGAVLRNVGNALAILFAIFLAINLVLLAVGSVAAIGYLVIHYGAQLL